MLSCSCLKNILSGRQCGRVCGKAFMSRRNKHESCLYIWKYRWWKVSHTKPHILWRRRSICNIIISSVLHSRCVGCLWWSQSCRYLGYRGAFGCIRKPESANKAIAQSSCNIWHNHLQDKSWKASHRHVHFSWRCIWCISQAFYKGIEACDWKVPHGCAIVHLGTCSDYLSWNPAHSFAGVFSKSILRLAKKLFLVFLLIIFVLKK